MTAKEYFVTVLLTPPRAEEGMKMNERRNSPKNRAEFKQHDVTKPHLARSGSNFVYENFPIKISHHVKHLIRYIIHSRCHSLIAETSMDGEDENEFNVQQSINYSIIMIPCLTM